MWCLSAEVVFFSPVPLLETKKTYGFFIVSFGSECSYLQLEKGCPSGSVVCSLRRMLDPPQGRIYASATVLWFNNLLCLLMLRFIA